MPLDLEVTLELGSGKRAKVNGAKLRAAEQLRGEVTTLVFTPDRLVVVKGGPAARRAYFDRVLGRLAPSRAGLSAEYGAAVGQRNAALRRVAQGVSSREALAPWNEQVSSLGGELVAGRHETVAALQPALRGAGRRARAAARPSCATKARRRASRSSRLASTAIWSAATTGIGPHLDDLGVLSASRDLRAFGSQGEQRLAVLALLLGEAELLEERRGTRPLLLLDDVLSELDPDRRRILADRVRAWRPGAGHERQPQCAAGRAGPDARGGAVARRHERGHVMERIGDAVRRELCRFGTTGEMTDLVSAWPEAVGETVARTPGPPGSRATACCTCNAGSSAWAFELQQLESEIAGRLREAVLGKAAPARLRFVPGPPAGASRAG